MVAHHSLFSYNVTKPYPYRWFTPVTIAGAISLTGIFSWLNYAANGFEMVVTTSSDPNATIADPGALRGLPPLLTSKYEPSCEPASVPVNSQFFTNNSGMEYEVVQILQGQAGTDSAVLPALAYSNNVLEACAVTSIQLEFSSLDRTGIQLPLSTYGCVVRTYATCNITVPGGPVTFNVANAYDLVPPTLNTAMILQAVNKTTDNIVSSFVSRNATTRASLWWGESVLSVYWFWFVHYMEKQNAFEGFNATKGYLTFTPSANSSALNILDPYFMNVDFRFMLDLGNGSYWIYWLGGQASKSTWDHAITLTAHNEFPDTWWLPAEKLAKSAWSTVLVDLGQKNETNILLDDNLLATFTSDFAARPGGNIRPGPGTSPYNASHSNTGPLGTTPAVIATQYICNVPRRKAISTILWSVILADMVFLQAIWTTFKLSVDHFLVKKRKKHIIDETTSEFSFDSIGKIRRVQTV